MKREIEIFDKQSEEYVGSVELHIPDEVLGTCKNPLKKLIFCSAAEF